jgi:DNA-binding response OmpR family regulator
LIVEDDPTIGEGLMTALRRAGHDPVWAKDGEEGERAALFESFGVVLLDLMLPKRDGREVCRNLREAGVDTPVLMLTARDEIHDRVEGLNTGADDYLVKPFAVEELLARISALARRTAKVRAPVLRAGRIELDTVAQTVRIGDQPVHLTQREFALLEALLRQKGRVLSRDAILERVFNNDQALPNTVSFHMSSLRKKVDPDARVIKTVHGFGYVAEEPED